MSGTIAELETGGVGFPTFPPEVSDQLIKKEDENSESFIGKLLRRLELGGKIFKPGGHQKEVCHPVCN